MFHSKNIENRITMLLERALRLVYDHSESVSFWGSLLKDKSVTIHQTNLQLLGKEIFKAKNGITPKIVSDLFYSVDKQPCNLRCNNMMQRKSKNSLLWHWKPLLSCAKTLWTDPWLFEKQLLYWHSKKNFNGWTRDNCTCRLFKRYIGRVSDVRVVARLVNPKWNVTDCVSA